MMNEESIKAWEQDHIELLTSREMGEWLYRRDMNARANKERQQGEWKRITMNRYLCFNCNCNVNSVESLIYKFCPKCGADMRKEAEDNG